MRYCKGCEQIKFCLVGDFKEKKKSVDLKVGHKLYLWTRL